MKGVVFNLKELYIDPKDINQRLDKYLLKYFNKATKSYLYKMLRKKRIKLNNKLAHGNEILQQGDSIQMYLADETISSFKETKTILQTKIGFKIIYEDKNICVVDKPQGVLSHPESGSDNNALSQQLLYYFSQSGEYKQDGESIFTPAICNRLDRNTSGIIVCGKNMIASQSLNEAFRNNNVKRFYYGLVPKKVTEPATIKGMIVKDNYNNMSKITKLESAKNAKEVITSYTPLKYNESCTLLEIKIHTGKSHQIRVQLSEAGIPIVGDKKYGNAEINEYYKRKYGLNNQFLHAGKLSFSNLREEMSYLNEKEFQSPLPIILNKIEKDLFL